VAGYHLVSERSIGNGARKRSNVIVAPLPDQLWKKYVWTASSREFLVEELWMIRISFRVLCSAGLIAGLVLRGPIYDNTGQHGFPRVR
jgi:hypothetical protein